MRNNTALKVLFVSNAIYIFAALLLGPLYAVYVQRIGGGVLLVSISTAVFYISSTLFLLFMARWGDRVREKELMLVISYIIRGLCFLCYIFIENALFLILVQVAFGLAESLGTPTFGVLFSKHIDKKEEVMEKIFEILKKSFEEVWNLAKEKNICLKKAAYLLAISRVAKAMEKK